MDNIKNIIRLINDIDLSSYAGTAELNNLRNIVFNGDFDGNGVILAFGSENTEIVWVLVSTIFGGLGDLDNTD